MKKSYLLLLCALLSLAVLAVHAAEEPTSPTHGDDDEPPPAQEPATEGDEAAASAKVQVERVNKIFGSEWYSMFDKHKFALVLFHDSVACGEICQRAIVQLESATRELYRGLDDAQAEEFSTKIKIGHVDCSKQVKLCNKYEKKQYARPVMSLFSKAVEVLEYDGTFDKTVIMSFIQKYKDATFVYSPNELPETTGPVVYGVFQEFNPKSPGQEYMLFMKAAAYYFAQKMPEPVTFVLSTAPESSAELATRFGTGSETKLVLVEHGNHHVYNGDGEFESLKQWIFTLCVPALVKADGSDGSYVFWKQGKPVLLFWLDYSTPLDEFLAMLSRVAEKHKGEAFFLYEDGTKVAKHMQWFGYSGEKFPSMIGFDTKSKVEYTYDENNELTEESIESFFADFQARKLKKYTRKQPVPTTPDTGATKTLVYDTFRTEVMDSTKDVAVFYYIPTCGFCMDFLAEFEKLANQLRGVTTLAFGKIDLSKNDCPPPIAIRNFPTVIMFPSEDKYSYKLFSSKRTIQDLLKFFQESARTPFEAPVMIAAEPQTDDAAEGDDGDEGDDSTHKTLNSLKDQIHH